MRRHIDKHNDFGIVWSAKTKHFDVYLELTQDYDFVWDGDMGPEDDTQAKLGNGDYVAFDSDVIVELHGEEIGRASLGGSVYEPGDTRAFMNDGYFKDMLREACKEARKHMMNRPTLRAV